ncbi:hypothetical protein [Streptomyces sp. NPDC001340]
MIVPTTNYIFADIVRGAREAVGAQGGRLVLGVSSYVDTEDCVQAEHLVAGGAQVLLGRPAGSAASRGRAGELGHGVRGAHRPGGARRPARQPRGRPRPGPHRPRPRSCPGRRSLRRPRPSPDHHRPPEGPHAVQISAGFQTAVRSRGIDVDEGAPSVREHGDYDRRAGGG